MGLKVKLPATVYLGSAVDPGSGGGGGGSSSFPTIVTDSGSSLPSASGYSVGDKFLNTSTKKIYTPVANGYIANTNATITATTIDWDNGIVSGISTINNQYCYRNYLSWNDSWNSLGETTKNFYVKFKLSSISVNCAIMYISTNYTGGPGSTWVSFSYVASEGTIFYSDGESYYTATVNNSTKLFNTAIEDNTIYLLNIQKTGTSCVAQLKSEDGTILEEKNFTTTDFARNRGNCGVCYGGGYATTSTWIQGEYLTVYLAESYGELIIPNTSTLSWDSGTDIIANTEYADKTNGKLYLYDGTTLLEITTTFVKIKGNATDNSSLSTALNNKQNKAIKFTNKSASNWVADNTYPDYGYKCEITNLNGVTSDSFAQVIFAQAEADSGNYATVCLTDFQKITIYSKVNDTITIPSIVVMGA